MHITLSGPYETLYTFAVDMWSFGCLCLNMCIGKTAALRQREVGLATFFYVQNIYASLLLLQEASLLLSVQPYYKELWQKTTKVYIYICKCHFYDACILLL